MNRFDYLASRKPVASKGTVKDATSGLKSKLLHYPNGLGIQDVIDALPSEVVMTQPKTVIGDAILTGSQTFKKEDAAPFWEATLSGLENVEVSETPTGLPEKPRNRRAARNESPAETPAEAAK